MAEIKTPNKYRNTERALKLLDGANGKIVSAVFVKRDGTERKMVGRAGVKKYLTGAGMKYDPIAKGLYPLFDMDKEDYRTINLKTLKELKVNGVRYYFDEDGDFHTDKEAAEQCGGLYGEFDPKAGF